MYTEKSEHIQGEGGKTDEVNKRQLGAVIPKVKAGRHSSIGFSHFSPCQVQQRRIGIRS